MVQPLQKNDGKRIPYKKHSLTTIDDKNPKTYLYSPQKISPRKMKNIKGQLLVNQ